MKHIAFAFLSALTIMPSTLLGDANSKNGIVCPTALDKRWVHILYDFKKDEQVVTMTNIVATAKAHGYTGVILGSSCGLGMLHLWDDARRARLMSVKKACDEA